MGPKKNKIGSENEKFYSWTYKDHVVEYYHWGEGGGLTRYTFQRGFTFLDGFLLANYFHNLFISSSDLNACESIKFRADDHTFSLETIGLRHGIYNRTDIYYFNGLLVIEIAAGC